MIRQFRQFKAECEAFGPEAPKPSFAGIIGGGLLLFLIFVIGGAL